MGVIKSQGVVFSRGDGADPEVFTAIGRVVGIVGLGSGAPTEIDTTDLSSVTKESIMGLLENDEITLNINLDTGDIQQSGLRADRLAGTLRNFQMSLPDTASTVIDLSAYIKTFKVDVSSDEKIILEATFKTNGQPVWS